MFLSPAMCSTAGCNTCENLCLTCKQSLGFACVGGTQVLLCVVMVSVLALSPVNWPGSFSLGKKTLFRYPCLQFPLSYVLGVSSSREHPLQ